MMTEVVPSPTSSSCVRLSSMMDCMEDTALYTLCAPCQTHVTALINKNAL